MAKDVGLPEQGAEELNSFLAMGNERTRCNTELNHLEMSMLAKAVSMQQAGILPMDMDFDSLLAKTNQQLQLEGLL